MGAAAHLSIIGLLKAWSGGIAEPLDRLMPMVYDGLRRSYTAAPRRNTADHGFSQRSVSQVSLSRSRLEGPGDYRWPVLGDSRGWACRRKCGCKHKECEKKLGVTHELPLRAITASQSHIRGRANKMRYRSWIRQRIGDHIRLWKRQVLKGLL